MTGILPATPVQLKLEGLSLTGSSKIKPAIHMLETLERTGRLRPGMRVIESSSGNLGLALSMACAAKGYHFTCVSDKNISPQTARLMATYGAKLIVVQQPDSNGGFLGTRIALIRSILAEDPSVVWINQYENSDNVRAHYLSTGPEVLADFPAPDYVFIGAGTTGTLGGVSQYLRRHSPATQIVAVDTQGSVTFGGVPGPRHIPGLGTSQPPAIREASSFDSMIMVPEADTVRMCRALASRGILLGGSSGTVLCGIQRYASKIQAGACVVAISPDMGDRYVDTIYNDAWVAAHFPLLADAIPTDGVDRPFTEAT
ncbi:pyridoxal-phosphate dependent enzyme family protein [Janthinobacterium agaricidamnosum NBRC 102515 = DSM 9628]|uniref:Pyridoxal-phosphate dependent enzyme family protein n=1 Tax=Janthinobacterium agaricidamnosum NBRC 102515 = DSM 9628 TaxID=1349767 RepID=W0VEC4_9BURK|nr:pyridoxal-phosphate dependent enzyme family protein [Janthinobacterium agaricidamnosum NBRC 102515 = DSM 9628]